MRAGSTVEFRSDAAFVDAGIPPVLGLAVTVVVDATIVTVGDVIKVYRVGDCVVNPDWLAFDVRARIDVEGGTDDAEYIVEASHTIFVPDTVVTDIFCDTLERLELAFDVRDSTDVAL